MLLSARARLLIGTVFAAAAILAPAPGSIAPAWAQDEEAQSQDDVAPTQDGEMPSEDGATYDGTTEEQPNLEQPTGEEPLGQPGDGEGTQEQRSSNDASPDIGITSQEAIEQANAPATATETPPQAVRPDEAGGGAVGKGEFGELLDKRDTDYYDRRAAEILSEDRAKVGKVEHPLQSAYPDHFVVVCEAGCGDGKSNEIVSMMPRPPVGAAKDQQRYDTLGLVTCVGGCPSGGSGQFAALPGNAAGGAAIAANIGEWMTTVARVPDGAQAPAAASAKAMGSGEWMNRINEDRAVQAPAAANPAAPRAAPAAAAQPAAASSSAGRDASTPGKAQTSTQSPAAIAAPGAEQALASKPDAPKQDAAPIAAKSEPVKADAQTIEVAKSDAAPSAKPPVTGPAASEPIAPERQVAEVQAEASRTEPAKVSPSKTAADAAVAGQPRGEAHATEQSAAESKPAPSATAEAASAPRDATEGRTTEAPVKVAAATPPPDAKIGTAEGAQGNKVMSVLSEDEQMNAAIRKARASLADFWRSYESPGANEGDFALKVAIQGNGATEHFWLTRIKRDGDKLSGVISNQPQTVKTVKLGQTYEFTQDMISDWTFKRNGKLVGNETMRVLLPRMPAEQAAAYRAMYETP